MSTAFRDVGAAAAMANGDAPPASAVADPAGALLPGRGVAVEPSGADRRLDRRRRIPLRSDQGCGWRPAIEHLPPYADARWSFVVRWSCCCRSNSSACGCWRTASVAGRASRCWRLAKVVSTRRHRLHLRSHARQSCCSLAWFRQLYDWVLLAAPMRAHALVDPIKRARQASGVQHASRRSARRARCGSLRRIRPDHACRARRIAARSRSGNQTCSAASAA